MTRYDKTDHLPKKSKKLVIVTNA